MDFRLLMNEVKMRRITVVGCPGSGKSTFSRELRDRLGLPLYYLDSIWHKPDRTNIGSEEFDRRLGEILERECWIIDGNYSRTMDLRISMCDTVFLFDMPTEVCLAGAMSRIGRKREELPFLESELDPEFREQILNFREKKLPNVLGIVEGYRGKRNIVTFHSHDEVNEYLASLNPVTYFSISGSSLPEEVEKRLGAVAEMRVRIGEKLPSGATAEEDTLVFGVNRECGLPLSLRLKKTVSTFADKAEMLAELRSEMGLRYTLFLGRDCTDCLFIFPHEVSGFLTLSDTVHDLNYGFI